MIETSHWHRGPLRPGRARADERPLNRRVPRLQSVLLRAWQEPVEIDGLRQPLLDELGAWGGRRAHGGGGGTEESEQVVGE